MGRSAQGVRILSIDKPDFVIGVDRIVKEDDAEEAVKETEAGNTETQDDGDVSRETENQNNGEES
jgi:DNA gyrase subunit A